MLQNEILKEQNSRQVMMGIRELGTFRRKAAKCERRNRREAPGSPVCCPQAFAQLPREGHSDPRETQRMDAPVQLLAMSLSRAQLYCYTNKQN